MSERPERANAAVLVGLDFGADGYAESLEELRLLAQSAGFRPQALIGGKRQRPDTALFAGTGKVAEIAAAVREHKAVVVVFNHELSPAQQRILEK